MPAPAGRAPKWGVPPFPPRPERGDPLQGGDPPHLGSLQKQPCSQQGRAGPHPSHHLSPGSTHLPGGPGPAWSLPSHPRVPPLCLGIAAPPPRCTSSGSPPQPPVGSERASPPTVCLPTGMSRLIHWQDPRPPPRWLPSWPGGQASPQQPGIRLCTGSPGAEG